MTTELLDQLIDLICAHYGDSPNKQQIREYGIQNSLKLSEEYVAYLRNSVMKRGKAKMDLDMEKLVSALPLLPSYDDTVDALRRTGIKGNARIWFRRIRKMRPDLWVETVHKSSSITLSAIDQSLLEVFRAVLGTEKEGKTVSTLIRVLALANYRQEINLPELVQMAKRLRAEDIEKLKNSFTLNLAKL